MIALADTPTLETMTEVIEALRDCLGQSVYLRLLSLAEGIDGRLIDLEGWRYDVKEAANEIAQRSAARRHPQVAELLRTIEEFV
jgi:hypothetical protein